MPRCASLTRSKRGWPRMSDVCVLGLGRIGLPTAVMLASHGHRVVGVDTNRATVEVVTRGASPFDEPGIPALLQAAVADGRLRAQPSPEPSDAFIIAVPTPVLPDKRPDMSYVWKAARAVREHLRAGNLVVVESTVPPGATAGEVARLLEEGGMTAGRDFLLAHCPERVLPGRVTSEIVENDRTVGGINDRSTKRAVELYRSFVTGAIHETDATTAEMVKLSENTYRDVNIALANTLANTASRVGVDAWRVIEIANRHPRVNLHRPGPGVGGHCIPVDPWFLVAAAPEETGLIRQAREVNDGQPAVVVDLALAALGGGKERKVAVLGVAYKAGTSDARGTPAAEVIARLRDAGVSVSAHDPHVEDFVHPLVPLQDALAGADVAIVLTEHSEYGELEPEDVRSLMRTPAIVDSCNCLDRVAWERAGFHFIRYGDGTAAAGTR